MRSPSKLDESTASSIRAVPQFPSTAAASYGLLVLFIAYVLSFVDRTVLALLVEPLRQDLRLTDTEISILQGFAFAIFYTALGMPLGRIADRHPRTRLISIGVGLWSIATVTCGLAGSFWQLFLGRIGVGVGEAALSPAAYSLIADYFPPHNRGRATGVYTAGAFFGAGLAFLLGGAAVHAIFALGLKSIPLLGPVRAWQLTFVIVGLPGLLVAAWVATLREPRRQEASLGKVASVTVWEFLRAHWRLFMTHFLGFSLLGASFNAIVAWLPTYLVRRYDLPIPKAALMVGVGLLVFATAGVLSGGWMADLLRRRGRRDGAMRIGVMAGIALIPAGIALGFASTQILAVVVICPLCFFCSFAFGAAPAALQQVTPNQIRGQIIAAYFLVLNLVGVGVGPTMVALLTDYLFASPKSIGTSLAVVVVTTGILAALLIAAGLKSFRNALGQFADSA